MPAVSAKQYVAMRAAASGTGTLGIPPEVAKKFLRHGEPYGGPERRKGKRDGGYDGWKQDYAHHLERIK